MHMCKGILHFAIGCSQIMKMKSWMNIFALGKNKRGSTAIEIGPWYIYYLESFVFSRENNMISSVLYVLLCYITCISPAVKWLKCCRYGVKLYPINQSIKLVSHIHSNRGGEQWVERWSRKLKAGCSNPSLDRHMSWKHVVTAQLLNVRQSVSVSRVLGDDHYIWMPRVTVCATQ